MDFSLRSNWLRISRFLSHVNWRRQSDAKLFIFIFPVIAISLLNLSIVHTKREKEWNGKIRRRHQQTSSKNVPCVCKGSRQIKSLLPILFALRCLHENVNIPTTTTSK